MAYCAVLVVAAILGSASIAPCEGLPPLQPLDSGLTLVSHEGDSAYLPCSYPQSNYLTILWKIRDILYPVYNLPNLVERVQGSSTGLVIGNVTLENSGNYSCYTYENSHLKQLYTIQLKVLPSLNRSKENSSGMNKSNKTLSLRVTKGDTIYIPCVPASGTDLVTLWRIDNIIYPTTNLPKMSQHHYGGIVVHGVSANTIGSTYECYSMINNNLNLLYTVKTALTNSSIMNEFGTDNIGQGNIKMISRKVVLGKQEKTFGFKFDASINTDCDLNALAYKTDVIDYTTGNIIYDKLVADPLPVFFIPNEMFLRNNTFAQTYTKNFSLNSAEPCAKLGYRYRTNATAMTNDTCISEGVTSCVQLPEELNHVNVIWPRYPASDDDCQCPIFMETSTGPQFSDCYCFALHLTSYTIILLDDQLCWKNLTRESNDTKILLARDETAKGVFTRDILGQTRITVQGPPPISPIVTYDESNNTLCAESKSEKWSPVIRAEVTVYDVTGDVMFDRVIPKSNFCLPLGMFPPICAPFNVSITASSQCTDSIPTIFYGPGDDSTLCECLQTKVDVTLNITTTTTTEIMGTLDISCFNSKDVDIIEISNLYLQVILPGGECDNCVYRNISLHKLPCFQNSSFNITDLSPSTEYQLLIKWISPNTSDFCQIGEENTFKTKEEQTNISLIEGIVGGVGGLVLIVLVFIIFLVLCNYCCRHSERRRSDSKARLMSYACKVNSNP